MTQPTDIEAIAAGLSECDLQTILRATDDGEGLHTARRIEAPEVGLDITDRVFCANFLTPLGLAVRNHLIERDGDE